MKTTKELIEEAKANLVELEKRYEEEQEVRLSDDVEAYFDGNSIAPYCDGRAIIKLTKCVDGEVICDGVIVKNSIPDGVRIIKGSDIVITPCEWEDLEVGETFWCNDRLYKKSTKDKYIFFYKENCVSEYEIDFSIPIDKVQKVQNKPKRK